MLAYIAMDILNDFLTPEQCHLITGGAKGSFVKAPPAKINLWKLHVFYTRSVAADKNYDTLTILAVNQKDL
jgi:hypothetical protein